jgi:hypothetical protein
MKGLAPKKVLTLAEHFAEDTPETKSEFEESLRSLAHIIIDAYLDKDLRERVLKEMK